MNDISTFFLTGISYRKSDAATRGLFAVSQDKLENVYRAAKDRGVRECFVLSTCNRSEIYGFAPSAEILQQIICSGTEGSLEQFRANAYILKGEVAIRQLFRVATGLDSQILGDYEIIGQLKTYVKLFKKAGLIGSHMERLLNEVVRATKLVRTNTAFSSGTVSVSFAAVQFIRQHFPQAEGKKILLVGTGKIGTHTCKYLVDYLPGNEITLINRSREKAELLASEFSLKHTDWKYLRDAVNDADIVLVATGAAEPVILKQFFTTRKQRLIIDFSIPANVDAAVASLPGLNLIGVDELSKIKDETLQRRASEIPRVEKIIDEQLDAYKEWNDLRKHVPVLKAVKSKLISIQSGLSSEQDSRSDARIQKVINGVALKMRTHNHPGCHYIEAINDFMAPPLDN